MGALGITWWNPWVLNGPWWKQDFCSSWDLGELNSLFQGIGFKTFLYEPHFPQWSFFAEWRGMRWTPINCYQLFYSLCELENLFLEYHLKFFLETVFLLKVYKSEVLKKHSFLLKTFLLNYTFTFDRKDIKSFSKLKINSKQQVQVRGKIE